MNFTPIFASNMDGVRELKIAEELSKYKILTALTKQHELNQIKNFTFDTEPAPQMISGPIVCNALLMFIKMINPFIT